MRKGFVFIPVLIIIALTLIGAIGYSIYQRSSSDKIDNSLENTKPTESPAFSPSPTTTPIPTATPTKKPVPTKKPNTPTPSPVTNATGCSQFVPENGLATITINLKEKDNQPLFGDWIVKIKPTGSCPAIMPYGNQPVEAVIRQGTYTYTSPGFHPGQVRVDVNYHFSGEGFDMDAISGSHSREINVSNN